ncbi:hypothetical protein A3Q56_03145 [Intoshia linei]|uniref:SUN domain-containing protein n=1 Tax=Intoshia linei TaxID=1819745 RepID=A0A177B497_9BILA|nr:hypothetical protein A3Q56_03145 [Intoshia linei]
MRYIYLTLVVISCISIIWSVEINSDENSDIVDNTETLEHIPEKFANENTESNNTSTETNDTAPKEDVDGGFVSFEDWKNEMKKKIPNNESKKNANVNNEVPLDKENYDNFYMNTNQANIRCGAKIVETNPQAKQPGYVLNENIDQYLLNSCSAEKFMIVQLCEPIKIAQVAVGNLEFFSSSPKEAELEGSDRFPAKSWINLGKIYIEDIRQVQYFTLPKIGIYIKFLKIKLLTHHGNQHYCPISIIRAYGLTITDDDDYTYSHIPIQEPIKQPEKTVDTIPTETETNVKPYNFNLHRNSTLHDTCFSTQLRKCAPIICLYLNVFKGRKIVHIKKDTPVIKMDGSTKEFVPLNAKTDTYEIPNGHQDPLESNEFKDNLKIDPVKLHLDKNETVIKIIDKKKEENTTENIIESDKLATKKYDESLYDDPNGEFFNNIGGSKIHSSIARLKNQVRDLEVNTNLSGTYLEKLSQNYKKTMESVNKTSHMLISDNKRLNVQIQENTNSNIFLREYVSAMSGSLRISACSENEKLLKDIYQEQIIYMAMVTCLVFVVLIFGMFLRIYYSKFKSCEKIISKFGNDLKMLKKELIEVKEKQTTTDFKCRNTDIYTNNVECSDSITVSHIPLNLKNCHQDSVTLSNYNDYPEYGYDEIDVKDSFNDEQMENIDDANEATHTQLSELTRTHIPHSPYNCNIQENINYANNGHTKCRHISDSNDSNSLGKQSLLEKKI